MWSTARRLVPRPPRCARGALVEHPGRGFERFAGFEVADRESGENAVTAMPTAAADRARSARRPRPRRARRAGRTRPGRGNHRVELAVVAEVPDVQLPRTSPAGPRCRPPSGEVEEVRRDVDADAGVPRRSSASEPRPGPQPAVEPCAPPRDPELADTKSISWSVPFVNASRRYAGPRNAAISLNHSTIPGSPTSQRDAAPAQSTTEPRRHGEVHRHGEASRPPDYTSIGDSVTGFEHFINVGYIADGRRPRRGQDRVDRVRRQRRRHQDARLSDVHPRTRQHDGHRPRHAGDLTKWHDHQNLCFAPNGRLSGRLVNGACVPGGTLRVTAPMMHRGPSAWPSTWTSAGSGRATAGSHQLRSPSSSIVAGTSTSRTMVASRSTATASPKPNIFSDRSSPSTKRRRRRT